jgi:hypothetical protein
MARPAPVRYILGQEMDMSHTNPLPPAAPETPSDRTARLERERALLSEGEAALAEGRMIADEDVEGWLDRLAQVPASTTRP